MLFHFTSQYAPEGNIGRYPDKRIAAALDWTGPVSRLIEGLTTSGWVDSDKATRLLVHDWSDHLDRSTKQRLARNGKMPLQRNLALTEEVCTQNDPTSHQKVSDSVPLPLPAPCLLPVPLPTAAEVPPQFAAAGDPEYPETARAIRERYPSTDDDFVGKLTRQVCYTCAAANGKLTGDPTDLVISEAVRACHKPDQNGAGLYMRTVPQCVKTWLTQGRGAPGKAPPLSERSMKALELSAAINRRMGVKT